MRCSMRRTVVTGLDFREVQATLAGGGVTNLIASVFGAVPNIINPGIVLFTQTTAARSVGYCTDIHSDGVRRRCRDCFTGTGETLVMVTGLVR